MPLRYPESSQGPALAVGTDSVGTDLTLSVRGELDLASAPTLAEAVRRALQSRPGRLVLDLSGTSFLDSTGCRELVRSVRVGRAAGVDVLLVVPLENSGVRRVLGLVGFGELAPVHAAAPAAA